MKVKEPILVSVIIPCYNVGEYIIECLDSVFGQTYSNLEVIVVDNNCTDDTVEKVLRYKKDKSVEILLVRESNQGLSYARNAGLAIAKGEWIQFLDADDLLMPGKIEHQVGLIQDDTSLIASANIERMLSGKEFVIKPHENTVYALIAGYRHLGSSCSNLWKRKSVVKLKGFDTTLRSSEEIDMMFRMYVDGSKIIKDNVPLTIIRKRESGQMSQWNKSILSTNWLKVREKQIQFFKNHLSQSLNSKEQGLILSIVHMHIVILYSKSNMLGEVYFSTLYSELLIAFKKNVSFKLCCYNMLYNVFGFGATRRLINNINANNNYYTNQ